MRTLRTILLVCGLAPSAAVASWVFSSGSSSYVTLDDAAALTIPDGACSFAGWINTSSYTGSSYRLVWYWSDGTQYWYLQMNEASAAAPGQLRLYMKDNGGSSSNLQATTNVGALSGWHHVAVVRGANGATVWNIYVDAVSDAQQQFDAIDAIDVAHNWYFGSHRTGANYYDGRLAEFGRWNSHALTGTELRGLAGVGCDPCSPNVNDGELTVPDICCEMYDGFTCELGSLTVTNSNATIDTGSHPIDYGSEPPYAVTMVWPQDGDTVTHKTRIVWTKTPPDTELAQTFTVYWDGSNPPTTDITIDETYLYAVSPVLTDGQTYYCRVDATSSGGTTEGDVVTVTAASATGTVYYASPGGTGDGSTEATPMDWADVASSTGAGDTIRIVDGDATTFNAYENGGSAGAEVPYTPWAARIYEADEVLDHGITWTFADWRPVTRFVCGEYGVVGPGLLVAYDPPATGSGASLRNGLMETQADGGQGLDGRSTGTYDADMDVSDEIPIRFEGTLTTYIAGTSLGTPMPSAGNPFTYVADASVLTVLPAWRAVNTWFRPSYYPYTGRETDWVQWSNVQTHLLRSLPLACDVRVVQYTADASDGVGPDSYEQWTRGPWLDLAPGYASHYSFPYAGMPYYGGYFHHLAAAILALQSDQYSLSQKTKLTQNVIQIGRDWGGIVKGGEKSWWVGDGGHEQGRLWPILWTGIMVNDTAIMGIGTSWALNDDTCGDVAAGGSAAYGHFHEIDQSVRFTMAEMIRQGVVRWTDGTHTAVEPNTPWMLHGIQTLRDSSNGGTVVAVENGSATVTGEVGEDWSTVLADPSDDDLRDWFITATYSGGHWYVLDEGNDDEADGHAYRIIAKTGGSPPTLTLNRVYEGTTNAAATFVIAHEVYVGTQYDETHNEDYSEFDETWVDKYWFSQRLGVGAYQHSSSVWTEETYQGLNADEWFAGAVCALLLQDTAGAVTKINSSSYFGYLDNIYNNYGSGGNPTWVDGVVDAYWQWPWPAPVLGPHGGRRIIIGQ